MIRSILKSLLKPEAYPEPTSAVEMVQTHVSWIFLTDRHAYKVKKPVNFGFLNFSTIDRRRFYCNEEIKLNRRLCPQMYEGVVELRQTQEGVAFHGTGQVLDYAVKMKRLPAERMLDRLVAEEQATPDDLREVARTISRFHQNVATSPNISEYGRLERILFNWQENFEQAAPLETTTLPARDREAIRNWVMTFMQEHAADFEQRRVAGFIRECDGDIHLENICLLGGTVCIFDCIEFNERFRCCDTAADVAFLLMDLECHRRRDLAQVVLESYLEDSGDRTMLPLIDFYKVYRAFVRGKVESFRLDEAGLSPQERELITRKAADYFRLARGYVERLQLRPTLFITCGLMGSGKTSLADQLAYELGIEQYSSDVIRKRIAGLPPETSSHNSYGQGLYDETMSRKTYDELARLAERELSAGRSAILDASFIRKEERSRCAQLARDYQAQFVILHVSCSDSDMRHRLSERSASGRSVSDGRLTLVPRQREEFSPPGPEEGVLISVASTCAPEELFDMIYERLRQPC